MIQMATAPLLGASLPQPSIMNKIEHGLSFTAKAITVGHAALKLGRILAPLARAAFV